MIGAVVVGQIARDLVLVVGEVPDAGGTAPVRTRRELLGGKGANTAVALAQLGMPAAVLGVVGDDEVGRRLAEQALRDRVDVSRVVRRPGCPTGLIVNIVAGGKWRYLEDLPQAVLLTEADVRSAAEVLRAAAATIVQLQQPAPATLAAARLARDANRLVVLDGYPSDRSILDTADVLRADAREASMLAGSELDTPRRAARAARELLGRHRLSLVAFAVDDIGNMFVWDGGEVFLPHGNVEVVDTVDTTGSGDALTAALTVALCRGERPETAARRAVAAAAATAGHPGGRPDLTA
jgi:ribokinase